MSLEDAFESLQTQKQGTGSQFKVCQGFFITDFSINRICNCFGFGLGATPCLYTERSGGPNEVPGLNPGMRTCKGTALPTVITGPRFRT